MSAGGDEAGEDLRPILFANGGEQLFGCLQLPVGARRAERAVVICPALGHEYERSHRALRMLAARLARASMASLRFDYRATSDSGGAADSAGPGAWEADIAAAAGMVRGELGVDRIALLGFRFGATLAARAAVRARAAALTLWHPVDAGADMLAEWDAADAAERRGHGWRGADGAVLGWPLPDTWRDAIAGTGLPGAFPPAMPTLILGEASREAAARALGAAFLADSGPPIWMQEPMDAIVPLGTVEAIVGWLADTTW